MPSTCLVCGKVAKRLSNGRISGICGKERCHRQLTVRAREGLTLALKLGYWLPTDAEVKETMAKLDRPCGGDTDGEPL